MKKAKIMLTAIAVFAVVGGALAFKAKSFSTHTVYTPGPNGLCTVPLTGFVTTNNLAVPTTLASTLPIQAACPVTRIVNDGI